MISLRSTLVLLAAAILTLVPAVLASATAQFHLNHEENASKCWYDCHAAVTSTILPEGVAENGVQLIGQNCRTDEYASLMSQCIPQYCVSAPDAAYAQEFAVAMCKKAGYDVAIELPAEYMEAAKGYFESPGYLNSGGVRGVRVWGVGGVAFIMTTIILQQLL